jgi:hypothetical protein
MTKTKLVMHNGHPRSCLCCQFFNIDYEPTGYCDSCAGTEGATECMKKVFPRMSGYRINTEEIAHLGQTCKEFQER